MHLHQDRADDRITLDAHISCAPMRLALLVLALLVAGCSSTEPDEPIPAGLAATVDGQPFRASIVFGQSYEPGTVSVSGAIAPTTPDGTFRLISLRIPAAVGTYTRAGRRASADYTVLSPADSSFQTWTTLISDDASLEVRVRAVDPAHVEGTFAFTAVGEIDAPGMVAVTGGTFNVGIGDSGRASVGLPLPTRR